MPLSPVQFMIAPLLLALPMMLPPKMVQPGTAYDGAIFDGATLPTLVGNVGDMSARVATMLMSAVNWAMSNIADAMTGFMAGSHVG